MIWQSDGAYIHYIVSHARKLGFRDVALFTNGTHPLDIPCITFIVTVDGARDAHNAIRTDAYDTILTHVKEAKTKVTASITLSKTNAEAMEAALKEITETHLFNGITFNLLTHNPDIVARHGFIGGERQPLSIHN